MLTRCHSALMIVMGGLVLAMTSMARAAPITFNTALPVSEDQIVVRDLLIVSHGASQDNSQAMRIEQTQITNLLIAGYGLTPKLAIFGTLPLTHIDRQVGDISETGSGVGDATVFARYELLRQDNKGQTTRLASFSGLRVPTGKSQQTLATGKGGTDILAGLIFTQARLAHAFGAQVSWEIRGGNAGLTRSNQLAFDGSLQYRILPKSISETTRGFVYGVLEGNLTHSGDRNIGGVAVPESGGVRAFIAPGLQYVTQRWIADIAVQLPVMRPVSLTPFTPDVSVFAGIRFNF